jgi:hypothetical protein
MDNIMMLLFCLAVGMGLRWFRRVPDKRGLLVAGGDRAKLLDLGEEVLDQMARAIKLSIVVARPGPVGSRRDHRGLTSSGQRLKDALIRVERLVGDQRIGRHRGQQVVRPRQVVCLAPGSERSQSRSPARRPGRGSWRSVRRVSGQSPGPHQLFWGAGAVLVGAHNGAVDHRVFVVGVWLARHTGQT